MSDRRKKETECLTRIKTQNGSLDDIVSFLLDEKLITLDFISMMKKSSNEPKELRDFIENLRICEKLQLVEYEWAVLPKERAIVTIVSDKQTKQFGFPN